MVVIACHNSYARGTFSFPNVSFTSNHMSSAVVAYFMLFFISFSMELMSHPRTIVVHLLWLFNLIEFSCNISRVPLTNLFYFWQRERSSSHSPNHHNSCLVEDFLLWNFVLDDQNLWENKERICQGRWVFLHCWMILVFIPGSL